MSTNAGSGRWFGFSQDSKRAWRNPWVIGWLALVLIVLLINAAMISLALVTSPGLVTKDYYEKGRDFEANLNSRLAARNALGWHMKLDLPDAPYLQSPEFYRVSVVDRVGQPLENAKVTLNAYRPSDAKADFQQVMQEIGPGLYQTRLAFALKGVWELNVDVERGEDRFEISRRLNVLAN